MNTVQFKINRLLDLQQCDMTWCFANGCKKILYSFKRKQPQLKNSCSN